MKALSIVVLWFAVATGLFAADPVRVTALHPILGDLARSVGGERVRVHDLLPLGGDPHTFEPTAKDLVALSKSALVLASGKKIEGYLPKVREATSGTVLEVGEKIPSLEIVEGNPLLLCCPDHAHGCIDPHWWQSPRHMGRAARTVADALSALDPDGRAHYQAGARATGKRMEKLDRWIRKEIAVIPRNQRKLVTAHLAFGYFCKDYGFQAMGLQGLARLEQPRPQDLADAVKTVKKEKVTVAFPERLANPKALESLRRETGIRLGDPLMADTMSTDVPSYEAMMRANVAAIVKGFTHKEPGQ